jgi:hypothetical protein
VSNPLRFNVPPPPAGEVVATFPNYEGAVAFVENLVAKEFPPAAIAIVGNDLRSVERVRGRLSYATVAVRGIMTGSWLGFIFGLFFTANILTSLQTLITWVMFGAAGGILFNVIRFSLARRKRGFISVAQFVAKEYQVQIQGDLVAKAKQLSGI